MMNGMFLILQRRLGDLDRSPWWGFLWRFLVVGACSRIWQNRLIRTDLPLDATPARILAFAEAHGLRPFLLNFPWRLEREAANLADIARTGPGALPTVAGVWAWHLVAILGLTGAWFLLGRLRRRMVDRSGPNLAAVLVLLAGGAFTAAALEGFLHALPGTFVILPPLVPVAGGWMSTSLKNPDVWHGAGLLLFFAECAFILAQGRVALAEARQGALRARLAPHFLFNALNTLHAQIERDPQGAQQTTERLAGIFRHVLAVSEVPTIPLREELAFVEDYLGIERERLGSRLRVSVEVADEAADAPIPVLGLQILVENALRHGVEPRVEGGEVRIQAALEGRSVRVTVTDPGDGASPSRGGAGKALANLRARLARPGDLRLGPGPGGHTATFTYPLSQGAP